MPVAWRSGSGTIYGDFKGMADALPYLKSLGITAIWMTPIHPSPAYHGYQYTDGGALNPSFGTEDDWRAFVHQAHGQGIRVFIDLVAYGVGTSSTFFSDAFGNPSGAYSNWFRWFDNGHTTYEGYTYPTWNGDPVGFAWWNLNNPGPAQVELKWALKWLNPSYGAYTDAGVDGFRCDHAVGTHDDWGPNGLGYTTANFWAPFRAAILSQYPKAILFAEQGDWSLYGNTMIPPFDATFTKPLEFAARDAIMNNRADQFMETLAGTVMSQGPTGTYLGTFGDHDVSRLTSAIGDTIPRAKLAAAMLMGQPYAPIIYDGDEIGMRGMRDGSYSGDAVDIPDREPFKWNAVAGSPMSNYFVLNQAAYDGRWERDNDGRSVEEQANVAGSLLETYRHLISIRHDSLALRRGDYEPIATGDDQVVAFARRLDHTSAMIEVFNLSDGSKEAHLNLSDYRVRSNPVDVAGPSPETLASITPGNQSDYAISLSGNGFRYITLELSPAWREPRVDGWLPAADQTGLRFLQNQVSSIDTAQLDSGQLHLGNGRVYAGLAGNLPTDGSVSLILLLDAAAKGENVLDLTNFGSNPGGISMLQGMRMPAGFTPDALLAVNCYGNQCYADWFDLKGPGLGTHEYRGSNFTNRLIGGLMGGENPNDLHVGVLDQAIANGTAFSDVTSGVEVSLPLADVPRAHRSGKPVRFIAFLLRRDGTVGNQFIPALPGPSGDLGIAPDLSSIAGYKPAVIYSGP